MNRVLWQKLVLLLVLGTAARSECFAQNMLIAGGEYNQYSPRVWDVYAGFNMELYGEHLQNDLLLSFGSVDVASGDGGASGSRYFFRFKDNVYVSWDTRVIGFRAGVAVSFGVYDVSGFPTDWGFLGTAAAFAGICLLPKALISVTVDVFPGRAWAFHATTAPAVSVDEAGFMLPIAVGIRFNLDKL
ncbi:MAG: hypothetical protein LBC72_01990 [Spirochaetaceae bacterium]|jgi:hypothetical protein|nr:hypothetical protein [Spirochaetaceae bacterium]